jgi:DNA replication regulator SLD2
LVRTQAALYSSPSLTPFRSAAAKYKQYNKVRDVLSGKIPPPSKDEHQAKSRKRKSTGPSPDSHSSPKRSKTNETPSKAHFHPDVDALAATTAITPSISRKLFSPVVPTSIGPTPQRDGRVLGLFDLLAGTPSRSNNVTDENEDPQGGKNAGNASAAVEATPSKHTGNALADLLTSGSGDGAHRRHNRTAMSSSKRAFLDSFLLTPMHRKRDGAGGAGGVAKTTPSALRSGGSVSRLQFATPAFLRRGNTLPLPALDENGEWKVSPLRLPRKLQPQRGLSAVVASLRRMEEEEADEELEALREMEQEEEGFGGQLGRAVGKDSVLKAPAKQVHSQNDDLQNEKQSSTEMAEVKDSQVEHQQAPVLLGGFDDEAMFDGPDEDQLDRGGRPLRVFKKKGQKRTTRLHNMRPTRTKRPVQPLGDAAGSGSEDDVVKETQHDPLRPVRKDHGELLDPASGSEFEGSEAGEEDEDRGKGKKGKGKTPAKKKTEDKEGPIKKVVRKVKATAHQNFKRLKLRNTGSKGGPGHNSRFRRRR